MLVVVYQTWDLLAGASRDATPITRAALTMFAVKWEMALILLFLACRHDRLKSTSPQRVNLTNTHCREIPLRMV